MAVDDYVRKHAALALVGYASKLAIDGYVRSIALVCSSCIYEWSVWWFNGDRDLD